MARHPVDQQGGKENDQRIGQQNDPVRQYLLAEIPRRNAFDNLLIMHHMSYSVASPTNISIIFNKAKHLAPCLRGSMRGCPPEIAGEEDHFSPFFVAALLHFRKGSHAPDARSGRAQAMGGAGATRSPLMAERLAARSAK